MNVNETPSKISETIELAPNFRIPIIIIISAFPLILIQLILGGIVGLFGIFLTIQTTQIKLKFTPDTLEVYRGEKILRTFPYVEWENWEIYWQPVPILFYFKEIKSIHFLPIIFDAKTLKDCLEKCFPKTN